MSRHVLIRAGVFAALLLAVACSKKEEAKPAAEAAAAAAGAAAGAVAAEAAKAAEPPPPPPPPPDVALPAGDSVVAWLSIRSFSAAFDSIEALASKFGVAPPGASLRQAALDDASKLLAAGGVIGTEWLDKNAPIHIVYQDDSAAAPQKGAAVLLPVVDKAKTLEALASAKKGADAAGHDAIVMVGQDQLYVDFLDKTMVLSLDAERFGKVKAFATRLKAIEVPALAYLGLSIKDAVLTRKTEIEAGLAQFEQMGKASAEPGGAAAMDYYAKMLREWSQSIDRVEILLDANTDDLQLGMRLHVQGGTKLGKQIASSRGRLAMPMAANLPANAYIAFVSNLDPTANLEQVQDSIKMLGDIFKLEASAVDSLEGDLRSALEKQDGTSAMALYPDGDAALGLLAHVGAKDPEALLKIGKKVASSLLLKAIEMEEAKAKERDPAAPADPKLAIVKKALTDMKVDPLIEAFGPVAKEAGVTITANSTKADGAACDVTDLTFDWEKIKATGGGEGEEADMASKVIGNRMAFALCTGADRLVFTVGPSAFEQGRRAATGKVGGLDKAPVFKAAAEQGVASPIWLAYINAGATVAAFRKVVPPTMNLNLPADRAVTVSCGHRAVSYACEVDVPVGLVQAIRAASAQPAPAP